jgi:hypothetical protein
VHERRGRNGGSGLAGYRYGGVDLGDEDVCPGERLDAAAVAAWLVTKVRGWRSSRAVRGGGKGSDARARIAGRRRARGAGEHR